MKFIAVAGLLAELASFVMLRSLASLRTRLPASGVTTGRALRFGSGMGGGPVGYGSGVRAATHGGSRKQSGTERSCQLSEFSLACSSSAHGMLHLAVLSDADYLLLTRLTPLPAALPRAQNSQGRAMAQKCPGLLWHHPVALALYSVQGGRPFRLRECLRRLILSLLPAYAVGR